MIKDDWDEKECNEMYGMTRDDSGSLGCLGMTYDDWDDKETLVMTGMTRND